MLAARSNAVTAQPLARDGPPAPLMLMAPPGRLPDEACRQQRQHNECGGYDHK